MGLNLSLPVLSATGQLRWALNNIAHFKTPPCAPFMSLVQADPKYLTKHVATPNYTQASLLETPAGSLPSTTTPYNPAANFITLEKPLGSAVMATNPVPGMHIVQVPLGQVVDVVLQNNPAQSFNGEYRVNTARTAMEQHPFHLHGHRFWVTGVDGGDVPKSARWSATTVDVSPGETRDVEFVADADGDWPLHCHRRHHPMNPMGHGIANMIGVDQSTVEASVHAQLPEFMAMGKTGMGEMEGMGMKMPENTLPMMGGDGQFGPVGMGGMFTLLKVRDQLPADGSDPGWYHYPKGTVAHDVEGDNDE